MTTSETTPAQQLADTVIRRPQEWLMAVDTEGGGFDSHGCALLQVGLVVLSPSLDVVAARRWSILPAACLRVELQALAVHGLDAEALAEQGARPEREVIDEILAWIRQYSIAAEGRLNPVAHNAGFDRAFMEAAMDRCDTRAIWDGLVSYRWRCSQGSSGLWRDALCKPGSTGLEAMAMLAGHWDETTAVDRHHDALNDALACAAVWRWLVNQVRAEMHLEALAAAQRELEAVRWRERLRPIDEYSHDDDGPVLWYRIPVEEPPYVGWQGDSNWPFSEEDEPHLRWQHLPVLPIGGGI